MNKFSWTRIVLNKTMACYLLIAIPLFVNSPLALAQKKCFNLSNGKTFCDSTLNVSDASEIAFFGQAHYSLVAIHLEKWGLKPIRLQNGNAIVVVSFINYKKTTIGPYREFILAFPCQTQDRNYSFYDVNDFIMKSSEIANDVTNKKFGYYMKKLVLDGEVRESVDFAIIAGREISGFPKEPGTVAMDIDRVFSWITGFTGTKEAYVQSKDGSWGLDFRMYTYLGNLFNASVWSGSYQFMTGLGRVEATRAEKRLQSSRPMPAKSWENRISAYGHIDGFPLNSISFDKWLFIPFFDMKFDILQNFN